MTWQKWQGPAAASVDLRSSRLNGDDPKFCSREAASPLARRPLPRGGPLPGRWHVPCYVRPLMLRLQSLRRMAGAALAAALAAMSTAGCSQYKPFDSAAYLRQQYAREVGAQAAAQIEVPFELDGEIRAAAA